VPSAPRRSDQRALRSGPRVAYLGPEGTFTHEAVLRAPGSGRFVLIPCSTIVDAVQAVREGAAEAALVPIENSIEGSVGATLDALVGAGAEVSIFAEEVLQIRQCLIAAGAQELEDLEVVVSHPQATAQCARFLRTRVPGATVMDSPSTAEAVRIVAEHGAGWAALGTELAARRYGATVLLAGVEDLAGNRTRFVWLSRSALTPPPGWPAPPVDPEGPGGGRRWKTAIVFWGAGADSPGWLVSCLLEFSERGVNLTRIESRPRREGLGSYMFFADLEGREREPALAEALDGVRGHVEVVRVLGCFPAAEA
jgi:prephenate dehydratase